MQTGGGLLVASVVFACPLPVVCVSVRPRLRSPAVPKGSTAVSVGRGERGLRLRPESRGAILQQLPMVFGRRPACGGPVGLQAAGGRP